MANKDKTIKELRAKLEKEKDSTTSEARSIRRKLRELGYYVSKHGEKKAAPKRSKRDKKGKGKGKAKDKPRKKRHEAREEEE